MRRSLSPKKQVLVICCGDTEENYFKALKNKYRIRNLTIINKGKKAPITLVKRIMSNGTNKLFQDIYIVCDKDDFNINEVSLKLKKEKVKNIKIVLSDPCFELWFILHYQNQGGFLTTLQCQKKWAKLYKRENGRDYKKTDRSLYELLEGKQEIAINNAQRLISNERANPFTLIHELLQELME